MIFHWSLSDSKSPQVFRTLLSILVDLNNAVVWMVSLGSLISKSSHFCINLLVTVPSAPITIGITVTFMFHYYYFHTRWVFFFTIDLTARFFLKSKWQQVSTAISCLLEMAISTRWQFLLTLFINTNLDHLAGIEGFVWISSKFHWSYFLGQIMVCEYNIYQLGQIFFCFTIPRGSHFPPETALFIRN